MNLCYNRAPVREWPKKRWEWICNSWQRAGGQRESEPPWIWSFLKVFYDLQVMTSFQSCKKSHHSPHLGTAGIGVLKKLEVFFGINCLLIPSLRKRPCLNWVGCAEDLFLQPACIIKLTACPSQPSPKTSTLLAEYYPASLQRLWAAGTSWLSHLVTLSFFVTAWDRRVLIL